MKHKNNKAILALALCAAVALTSCSSAQGGSETVSPPPSSEVSVSVSSAEETAETASREESSAAQSEASSKESKAGTSSSSSAASSQEEAASKPEPVTDDTEMHQTQLVAMDTSVTFTTYGGGEVALDAAKSELERLEKKLSVTGSGDVARLNAAGGEKTDISEETEELLRRAMELNEQTDGAFDVTLYPVLKKWGFTGDAFTIPTDSELKELMALTGPDKLTVSEGSAVLKKGSMIDLGGVAKGYIGDKLVKELKAYNVTNGLVSLGGAVWAIGTKPDGSLWKVGIADPDNNSQYVAVLSVSDTNVETSGGYERKFDKDGKTYIHILDPKTGKPIDPDENGVISATVVSSDGTLCDALTTALFVMGKDKAVEYLKAHSDIQAVLITSDRSFIVTSGLSGSFKASGNLAFSNVEYIN